MSRPFPAVTMNMIIMMMMIWWWWWWWAGSLILSFFLRSLFRQLPCLSSPWSIHLKPFLWLHGFCVKKKKKNGILYSIPWLQQHHQQQNNNCRRKIFCVTLKHKTIWAKTPFSYLNVKKKKRKKKDTESFDQCQMS